jgi:TonB-linked SusC/RagA family outer membrane protein
MKTLTGRVTDEAGSPVVGATVSVIGSNVRTSTNATGNFTIGAPANASELEVTFVGFSDQRVSITNQATYNIRLTATASSLGDVVVTGYQTRRRSEFTGATAKVAARQIEQVPLASFEQILQGRAPGLYIASGSGQPGTAARVNIRGVGSISGGNDPLYVLDGIPIEPGVFRSLNPNDFESVDVLKDAAGAGLYGSRGANGVIVITSKRGKSGRTQLQYRGQTGHSVAPKQNNLKLMNTAERLQYEETVLGGPAGLFASGAISGYPGWDYSPNNPRYASLSASQKAANAAALDSIRAINTDWPGIFFQKGRFSQHEVSASGGSQGLSFYTSLSAFNQQGVVVRSNLDRYTFRANIDFKTSRLSVNVRSAAGWSSSNGIESEAAIALANPIAAAFLELPYVRLNRVSGGVDTAAGKTGPNAYDRIFTTTALSNQFKGNLGVTIQFDIWGGISFKTTNGVDWRNNNSTRFIKPNSFVGRQVTQGNQGSYNEGNLENLQLITTSGFVFNRTFNDKHIVNATAMIEAIRNRSRSNSLTGFGINPALPNTPAGITAGSSTNNFIPLVSGARTVNGLYSQFLTADYTFDRRYTISASIRNDAPSQVPEANRNNLFWTAGASWNIIREKFMENQKLFQDARLRASYGETGNVNGFASDFGYISTYGASAAGYAGASGIIPTSPGNLDYRLESQVISNIGLDFTFLNKRIRTTTDYYVKNSRNLFINQNLSRTTGFTSLSTNAGEMQNRGFEFSVNGDVVAQKDLLVTLGINGAFNKNTITSLGPLKDIPAGTGIYRVGYSFGTHYTVGYLGVDPQSGRPVYQDINGNPTTIYNASNNRAEYGTYLPSFTGGATLDVTYRGFNLSALMSTAQGVKRFNNESFFYETTSSNVAFNKRVDMLTSWQKPGDMTNYQRITAAREFSSRDIQDASFIRFRNLQLGYTYTPKNGKFIRSARFWGQGQNLYTWTKWQGFDPEESNNIASYEFPNPKTYTIGVDINF